MKFGLIAMASAAVLGLLVREYFRQRRVTKKVASRPGLSRADFAAHFLEKGIPVDVSSAVFDSLVGTNLAVDPSDDLSIVYEIDHELFLESLASLQKSAGIDRRTLNAAWKEFGNVSTVQNLVEMIALARAKQDQSKAQALS